MNFISQVKKNPLIYVALVVIILYAYLKLFRSEGAAPPPTRKRVVKLQNVGAGKEMKRRMKDLLQRSRTKSSQKEVKLKNMFTSKSKGL
jgi:hypothetical protein